MRVTISLLLTILLGGASVARGSVDDFRDSFVDGVTRPWIGRDYFANRYQDWRLHGGRVECIESAPRFPLRTLHLLTRSLRSDDGSFQMRIDLGPLSTPAGPDANSWAGFLIGGGGPEVDYRLTAMTHHRPAPDGGILAVIDGAGRVAFRDNAVGADTRSGWSIGGALGPNEAPLIPPAESAFAGPRATWSRITLELTAERESNGAGYRLSLAAIGDDPDEPLSRAVIRSVAPEKVDGCIAIVSHRGGAEGGFWFDEWTMSGEKIASRPERAWGPVLATQYTVSAGALKLTAHMAPLGPDDPSHAELHLFDPAGGVEEPAIVLGAELEPASNTFLFRLDDWSGADEAPYLVSYTDANGAVREYRGTIRTTPADPDRLTLASLTCHKIFTGDLRWNHGGVWFPHDELVNAVRSRRPDLLYFSGDQIYEGDLTPADRRRGKATLDYLHRWSRFLWAFGDLTRDIPSITIPDDHDVYHGNIWGAGGVTATDRPDLSAQDRGGYRMPPKFVNVVHRTQTAHLPDPYDPAPLPNGVSVYFTRLEYGGVSFAILADRQFKSAPSVVIPNGRVVNGWFQNPDFDPARDADVDGAELLGARQLAMLDEWAADWSNHAWTKVALSQTIFSNLATIPADTTSGASIPAIPIEGKSVYPSSHKLAADADSNGWPQTGRNEALRRLRSARAIHIAGDQHLGAVIQYGMESFRDGPFAFSTPAITNTWPRRWFPPEPGMNRSDGDPRYTGDFLDGFGNRMTVAAVANPFRAGIEPAALYDRAPGFGVVVFDREQRTITLECWPRWVHPDAGDTAQYKGWPIVIRPFDNDGREPIGILAPLEVTGLDDPVLLVFDEHSDELEYALRLEGGRIDPPAYGRGPYRIRIGDPDADRWREIDGLTPLTPPFPDPIRVDF
ncbi:MAG: alkaline phosphatase D family protein [Phycisphaerales bacterium]